MTGLSKKASCMGCLALVTKDASVFKCILGVKLDFEVKNGLAFSPVPLKSCRKPKEQGELRLLVEKHNEKVHKRMEKNAKSKKSDTAYNEG